MNKEQAKRELDEAVEKYVRETGDGDSPVLTGYVLMTEVIFAGDRPDSRGYLYEVSENQSFAMTLGLIGYTRARFHGNMMIRERENDDE